MSPSYSRSRVWRYRQSLRFKPSKIGEDEGRSIQLMDDYWSQDRGGLLSASFPCLYLSRLPYVSEYVLRGVGYCPGWYRPHWGLVIAVMVSITVQIISNLRLCLVLWSFLQLSQSIFVKKKRFLNKIILEFYSIKKKS